jgi:hypothetical protein
MAAKQEDVEKIIATVPGFQTQWQEFLKEYKKETSPPWYLVMGALAHYLVENYAQRTTAEFPDLFASVEALLHKPDPELENLITVGLLEDIQNVASHRDFGAAPFLQWLGPRSLGVWNEISAYMKRVSDWAAKQEPRREAFDAEKALSQVENPQLKKIIESMYRKKS